MEITLLILILKKITSLKSPKEFIELITILNFFLGLGFIIYGIYQTWLVIYHTPLFKNGAEVIVIIRLVILLISSILFIVAGVIEILSCILLLKKPKIINFRGTRFFYRF